MTRRYYESERKVTYTEADDIVASFVESTKKTTATSRDVAAFAGVDTTRHNLIRIHDSLSARYDVVGSGYPKRFEIK